MDALLRPASQRGSRSALAAPGSCAFTRIGADAMDGRALLLVESNPYSAELLADKDSATFE
jgi:hypothetical protein